MIPNIVEIARSEGISGQLKSTTKFIVDVCPFCGAKKHLTMNPRPDVNGFRCVKCEVRGGALDFVRLLHDLRSNREAFAWAQAHRTAPVIRTNYVTSIQPEFYADPDKCDKVYRAFLAGLRLLEPHKADLKRRGLTDEEICAGMYRSIVPYVQDVVGRIGNRYDLRGVGGFYRNPGGAWRIALAKSPGYYVPVRDMDGRITGLVIRNDQTEDAKRPKYLNLSSDDYPNGTKGRALPNYSCRLGQAETVIITEGILKSNVAYALAQRGYPKLAGKPVIGIVGVSTLKPVLESLPDWKKRGVKNIYVAYDADKIHNDKVREWEAKLVAELRKAGFRVATLSWPIEKGKGIDDFLLNSMA
jgi:hypothetical protein